MIRIKEFFWFLAGAEVFILKDCPTAQNKFLRTGIIIFLIGIISGISAGYAVYGSFDGNIWASLLVGMLWSIVIMTLDSLIVSTIKDTGSLREKIKIAIPRIILSIFIGIVIARPAEIKIFEKEIKDQLIDIQLKKCEERTSKETKIYLDQNEKLENERKEQQKKFDKIYVELSCVQSLLTDERNGIASKRPCGSSSGSFGIGVRYNELNKRISELTSKLNDTHKRISELNTKIDENDKKIKEANQPCNKDSIYTKIYSNPLSLLEANSALNSLIFDDSENQKGVGSIILFVTILIVAIELLPVLNKVLFQEPSIEYEQKLQEFKKDIETMNYLDLILKYPHLPARKHYLLNYQNNKMIYKKLLYEYAAISELNSEVQNKIDIIMDKLQIQRLNEQSVNQQIADDIKNSQIKIVQELIKIWEYETLNDIKQNPQNYIDMPSQNSVNQNI